MIGKFLVAREHVQRFLRAEHVEIMSKGVLIQIAGYVISLILTPISIIFYSPTEFGLFGTVTVAVNMIGGFGGLRLEWAVINEDSTSAARFLVRFSFSLLIFIGFVVGIFFLFLPESAYAYVGADRVIALLCVPMSIAVGLGIFQQAWGIRSRAYRDVYFSRNAVMITRQAIQIALGVVAPSIFSLLASEFLARVIGIEVIRRRLQLDLVPLGLGRFVRNFRPLILGRYGRYSRVGLPASLLDFFLSQGLTVVFVPLYGLDVAGAYWLTQRIFAIPLSLIGTVAADVFQGQIARQGDSKAIVHQMISIGSLLAVFSITVLPAAVLVFWALAEHLYAGKWAVSGEIALYFLPALCVQFVASPISRVLIVLKKMQYNMLFGILHLAGLASWLAATNFGALSVVASLIYLAAIQFLSYAIYIGLSFYVALREQ